MKIIKEKKIKPLFDKVLVTCDTYEEDYFEDGIITHGKGEPKMIQRVISCGSSAPVVAGQLIKINPIRYAKMKHNHNSIKDNVMEDNSVVAYVLPIIPVGDEICMLLEARDIDYIIEEFDEIESEKKSSLIIPQKPKIEI